MADKQQAQPKKQTKKEVRKQVYEKLAGALADFKKEINEKKFENRLRKVSKIFAVDIVKAGGKQKKLNRKQKKTEQK